MPYVRVRELDQRTTTVRHRFPLHTALKQPLNWHHTAALASVGPMDPSNARPSTCGLGR